MHLICEHNSIVLEVRRSKSSHSSSVMAAFEAEDEPDPPSEDSDDSTVAELITFSFPNSALWSPCCAKSALTLHYHKEKFALRQLLHFEFRLHVGSKLH